MVPLILLVDDDSDDREFFTEALSFIDPRIRCVTVIDGLEAIDYLKSCDKTPDFIFLDINMPRMGGKKCLKELKRHSSIKHIPVIMQSTSRLDEDVREMSRLGATAFLKKPAGFEALCNELRNILGLRASEADDASKSPQNKSSVHRRDGRAGANKKRNNETTES